MEKGGNAKNENKWRSKYIVLFGRIRNRNDNEVTIRRIGKQKALNFEITREIIEIKSVKNELIDNFNPSK